MPPRLKSALSVAASLALAAGLLYLALREADLEAVGAALVAGEWAWIVPFAAVALLSVVVRAWRWGLLIRALPDAPRAPLGLTSASVAIGYLVNYAAPRLGEVARTANVARRSGATFSGVLGTVVAERLLDVVTIALVLAGVAVAYRDRAGAVWAEAEAGVRSLAGAVPAAALVAVGVAAVLAAGAVGWALRRGGGGRLAGLVGAFRDGLATILRTGRAPALLGSTVLLWSCYALMTDLPFRLLGLDAAFGLGLGEAWAVMAVGGIGMALPAPGGTGSFHYATVLALTLLFAVPVTPAATYAILVHAAGLVFYSVVGGAALVWQGTGLGVVTQAPAEPS